MTTKSYKDYREVLRARGLRVGVTIERGAHKPGDKVLPHSNAPWETVQ